MFCTKADLTPENWIVFGWSFLLYFPWLGGVESDEGIEIYGRPEGVHFEAGQ
jgi:hypothetical protein